MRNIYAEVAGNEAIIAMVSSGCGVTLFSKQASKHPCRFILLKEWQIKLYIQSNDFQRKTVYTAS